MPACMVTLYVKEVQLMLLLLATLLLPYCPASLFIHSIFCFFPANDDADDDDNDDDDDMIQCDVVLYNVCYKLMGSQNRKLTKPQTKNRNDSWKFKKSLK